MKYMELDVDRTEIKLWIKDTSMQECFTKTYYFYPNGVFKNSFEVLRHAVRLAEQHQVSVVRVLDGVGVGCQAYDWLRHARAESNAPFTVEQYITRTL
jgi:hypothetical protein